MKSKPLRLRSSWIGAFAFAAVVAAGCNSSPTSSVSDGGTGDDALGSGDTGDAANAMLVISPGLYDFGSVLLGVTKGPVSFQLTNAGGGSTGGITPSMVGPNSSEFSITKNNCLSALGEGESCSITVSFKPATPGPKVAGLQVVSVSGGTVGSGLTGTGVSASAIIISPNIQMFGSVVVGGQSPIVNFTVTNTGGVQAGAPVVTLAGGEPSEFSIQANACTAPLAPAAKCVVGVRFNPNSIGSKSAILGATSSPGGTTMAAISGIALDPKSGLSISPSLNEYGPVLVGSLSGAVTFTLTNTGEVPTGVPSTSIGGVQPGQFQISANTCTAALAPAATCTVQVKFGPTSAGGKAASLDVSASPGGTVNAALSGSGSALAFLAMAPSTADLGAVVIGSTSEARTFTVTNSGDVDTGVLLTAVTGPEAGVFSLLGDSCVGKKLVAGGSCTIGVRFTPTTAGPKGAILTVTGLPGGTAASAVTGRGLTPGNLTISPGNKPFNGVVVGQSSAAQLFTVSNTGSAPTGPLQVVTSGPHSAQFPIVDGSNNCAGKILITGGSCTLSVVFRPTGEGDRNASLGVSANPGGAVFATLSGIGISPAFLTVSPSPQDFGSVVQGGSSSNVNFVVHNSGGQPSGDVVVAMAGQNPGDFVIVNNGCSSLAGGGNCTVVVRFAPSVVGDRTAQFEASSDPGGKAVAPLTGRGIKPAALSVTPTPFTFEDLVVGGQSPPQLFVVKNTGGDNSGTIAMSLSGINAAMFAIVANGCTSLNAGDSCGVTVRFAPTSGGNKIASLDAKGGDGLTVSAALSGRGIGKLIIEPTEWDFDEVSILNQEEGLLVKAFTVTCIGGGTSCGPLDTGITTGAPAAFAITKLDTCDGETLAANGNCTIVVQFLPTTIGHKQGTLTVTGAEGESASAALSGDAVGCQSAEQCGRRGECESAVCNVETGMCGTVLAQHGTTCRPSLGVCDVAEECSGESPSCPQDGRQEQGTQCRSADGDCDVAEVCNGEGVNCPDNGFKSSEATCRASAGGCDLAEHCSGEGANCPADAVQAGGMVCRLALGDCDVAETCNGESAACPTDQLKPAETTCRLALGDCDVTEVCNGESVNCPVDAFQNAETVCRQSLGSCDPVERCTGTGVACPNDLHTQEGTPCRASAGMCDVVEHCTGGVECPVDGFVAAGTSTCRAAAGDCDVAEQCSGEMAACPDDVFVASTMTCRGSAGDCDVAEMCTGTTATCPTDVFQPDSTVCRATTGDCDVAEKCTGNGAACPANTFLGTSTVCRAKDGDCDTQEVCSGAAADCPANAFLGNSTVCRATAGVCDPEERCSGEVASCPADTLRASTISCRDSAGDCDVGENCTGTTPACPDDVFEPASKQCRASGGDCDVAESCTGSTATCPTNAFQPSSQECRAKNGDCDVAETCTGSGAVCPDNGFEPSSTTCRVKNGECDLAETCTGNGTACPDDAFQANGFECRAKNGDCDVAETCSGSTGACPTDGVVAAETTVCRAVATGVCDVAESCDGTNKACPTDQFQGTSVVCRQAAEGGCDAEEKCPGSSAACPTDVFQSNTVVCRMAVGMCDADEKCTGNGASCPTDLFKDNGTACTDGDVCTGVTSGDKCTAGQCVGAVDHCGDNTCSCTETYKTCHADCVGPGDPDKTFGTDGVVRKDFQSGTDDVATSVAIIPASQNPDSQMIVVGGYTRHATQRDNFLVARFTTAGAFDSTFNGMGWRQVDFGNNFDDRSFAMALDVTNQKIVLAGASGAFAHARFDFNGALDLTYNMTGLVTTDSSGGGAALRGVVVQPTGEVVVAGEGILDDPDRYKMIILRYLANGSGRDTAGFNPTDGFRILPNNGTDHFGGTLVQQSDGKFVVGGGIAMNFDDDMLVCRVKTTGALDDTTGGNPAPWGTNGCVPTDFTAGTSGSTAPGNALDSAEAIQEIALDSSGRVVAVGAHYPQTAGGTFNSDFAIVRYTTAGALDTTFGGGTGRVTVDFDGDADGAYGVAIAADGKIVVVGESRLSGKTRFAFLRLNPDGTLDDTFGPNGKVTMQIDPSGFSERAEAVALQANGMIVASGWTGSGTHRDLVVVRLLAVP